MAVGGESLGPVLGDFLGKVFPAYFSHFSCVLLLGPQPSSIVTDSPVVRGDLTHCETQSLEQLLRDVNPFNCHAFIVETEDAACWLDLWNRIALISVHRHYPRVLLLPINASEYAAELFAKNVTDFISELVAIEAEQLNSGTTLHLLTNDFSKRPGQENRLPQIELGTFSLSAGFSPPSLNLYPDKIIDLQGKEIRYATFDYIPFTLLEPFGGYEGKLALEFCRRHNCTIKVVSVEGKWGKIFEDEKNGDGVLGAVFMDDAELGGGAVFPWEQERLYVSCSHPVLFSSVNALVPKAQQLPKSLNIILPFVYSLWIIYIVSIFVFAAILHFIDILELNRMNKIDNSEFSTSFIRIVGMSVLQPPSTKLPSNTTLRQIFTLLEILFLLLTASYSGALASFLTVPTFYPPIDTLQELMTSTLKWASDNDAWLYSFLDDTSELVKSWVSRFELHPTQVLIDLSYTGRYGYPVEMTSQGYFSKQTYLTKEMFSNMHLMKDKMYGFGATTIMRKGSPYEQAYNDHIHLCLDHGLVLAWETITGIAYLSPSLQVAAKISAGRIDVSYDEVEQLQVSHLGGAFIMLGLGYLVALFTLLFEISSTRYKKLKFAEV